MGQESLAVQRGGLDEGDECLGPEVHVVVHHQDGVSGGTGAWEQARALVPQVVFEQVGARVVHEGGRRVVEGHCDAVHLCCHDGDIGMQRVCLSVREVFLDDAEVSAKQRA